MLRSIRWSTSSANSLVHKFGQNDAVSTTFVPVARGGVYQTPQVGSATALRVKAGGNENDTAAGSGAREVTLIGLDASGNEQTVAVATNGASASTATTETWIRLYRAYVSKSGTYATASAGSHSADIVIEDSAGSADWATIHSTDFARSQTEIAVYSVADGKTAYVLSAFVFADTSKTTELIFFQRTGILQTAAPYDAMRILYEEKFAGGEATLNPRSPMTIAGPADIGFMAKINTGTATVECDFEILLVG
jgi:hypothetical protein